MGQKDFFKKFFAGLFFIGCVVMISGMVFILGLEKGFTEPKFTMKAVFHEIGGLNVGAPVRLSGVTVGTVADIGFLEQEMDGRGVWVELRLFKKFEKVLRKSSEIAIITEGVLGEKIVEIKTTPDFYRADLNVPVVGVDPLDVQNLAETFGEAAVALLESSQSFETISQEMLRISGSTKRLLNRIEMRIIDGNLFKVF